MRCPRRFGQGLGKAEVGFKTAGWQVGVVVQLAGVGDPFVDQNEARPIFVHQFAEGVARVGGALVVLSNLVECRPATELPSQFAPQRPDHSTIFLCRRIAGRDLVADQHDPFDVVGPGGDSG